MAINKIITKPPKSHSGLKNCLAYVLRSDKTEQKLTAITGPYHHKELNANFAYQSFLQEKRIWHKDKGRMCSHSIISWHKDEKITQEKAFAFGQEFAEKWFTGFQTVIAVHQDRDHIHCHLVTNSVSYEDGRKYHTSKKDLERMKLSGWNVHWKDSRKHITFENKDGKKVRDSNLFKTFHLDVGKEGLEREFIRQRENTELSEQELEQYYRQLEDIDVGNVTQAQRELVFESGAIRSESQSARRTSESSNRSVRYNEAQSTTEHRERQLAEQRRLDAERAAREARKRNRRRSGPEL